MIRSRVPRVFFIYSFLPFSRLAPYLLPSLLINLIYLIQESDRSQQEEEGGGEVRGTVSLSHGSDVDLR